MSSLDERDDSGPKPPTDNNDPPEARLLIDFPQLGTTSSLPDPPPPYRDRRHRHSRQNYQHPENYFAGIVYESSDDAANTEASPLLGHSRRRDRAISHSSTALSTQSFAHNVISLFQAEFSPPETEDETYWARTKRYFHPMKQSAYYAALFHLLVLNFPMALAAWIYLFVATFAGAALLLALPIGALLCWLAVFGGRVLARGEAKLQMRFHGPLSHEPPNHPYFWRTITYRQSHPENGETTVVSENSFIRSSYAMFTDPVSYQNLFYFLVVKPASTLLIFLGLVMLIPPSFVLVVPFPAVLRAVRKIGILQANVALESLS